MIRVYRSDSPLLDYINVQMYRSPAYFGLKNEDGKIVYDQVMYLIGNLDLSSKENYLSWVDTWKKVNRILSDLNHDYKRPKTYSLNYTNTLENTFALIVKEETQKGFVVECSDRNRLMDRAAHRIETYTVWASKALTALYAARQTGKLATSAIVAQNDLAEAEALYLAA